MATIAAQQTIDSPQAPVMAAGAAHSASPQEILLHTGLAYIASPLCLLEARPL